MIEKKVIIREESPSTLKMIKTEEESLIKDYYQQTVEFNGTEDQNSVEICSTNVAVIPSSGGHDHGSSKVKLKNIVDFTWEPHFYTGQLLAVHMSGKYLAYGIKSGSGAGMVRVIHKDLEQRSLLRGMQGAIQDLAFAHTNNAILACIDFAGSVFVYTIVSSASQIVCNVHLAIEADNPTPMSHRLVWCPYIPEEDNQEDDVSKLLIVTRGNSAELWSIDNVFTQLGSGPLKRNDPNVINCGGFTQICEHDGGIVEAILSPDGTAIATASLDGRVKFFQINVVGKTLEKPSCLHKWKPHEGRPISSLFFLDDYQNCTPEAQFWRFAVTGCDNNSEIKIWSCEKWVCLQTIKFQPSPSTGKIPVLKAGMDPGSGFLLMSDICNKALYILSLTKDSGLCAKGSDACVSTISEFLLPYPILSFAIVDAGLRKVRTTGESMEDLCPCDEESEDQLMIRMYLVQPKSLQECHIAFQPAKQISNTCFGDRLTHDSLDYPDDIQHIGHEQNGVTELNGEESSSSPVMEPTGNHSGGSLNLMTPDAFSSPAKKDNVSSSTSPELGNVLSASPSLVQAVQALNIQEPPLSTSEIGIERAPQSGGSSPSREVREILSLAEPEEDEEEEEEIKEMETKVDENWSNIPMVLLKDVHMKPPEEPEQPKDFAKSEQMLLSTHSAVISISSKLDTLMENLQEQRREMNEIRADVAKLKQETPMASRLESAIARISQQQFSKIEQSLYTRLARQNEFLETVENAVKANIERTLPSVVDKVVEPLNNQIRNNVQRVDELMKENLTQLIGGAHMRDIISLTVCSSAKPALDNAFREAFSSLLLPGIERSCQMMFKQVQDAFARGTIEYLQHIEPIIEKTYKKRNDQQNEDLSLFVQELRNEMRKGLTTMQEGLVRTVKESVRENLGQQLIDMQARSRATTPGITVSSPADAQARVMSLLQRGQLNAAFQQALSASDLGLVVFVCEKTEPARVFPGSGTNGQNNRCVLQQPVILSLVQQLSADLGHRTELKHKWLEEAILNLDPTDPVTREHMGTVLMTLQSQLAAFVNANPTHRTAKSMKMLAMAASALLNQRQ